MLTQGEGDPRLVATLVEAYHAGDPAVDEAALLRVGGRAVDAVLPIVLGALGQADQHRSNALSVLARSRDPNVSTAADRAVLHALTQNSSGVDYEAGRYIENRLWVSSILTPELESLVRYANQTCTGPGRRVLMHPLMNPRSLRDDSQKRQALFYAFIETSRDPDDLELAARSLINILKDLDWWDIDPAAERDLLAGLRRVLERLKASEADRMLIEQAYFNEDFAQRLARWLADGDLLPFGGSIGRYKILVSSGIAPHEAAQQRMGSLYPALGAWISRQEPPR